MHFIYGNGIFGDPVSGAGIAATSLNVTYNFLLHMDTDQGKHITDWSLTMGILHDNNTWATTSFSGTGTTGLGTGSIALTSNISSYDRVQVDLNYNYAANCSVCSLGTAPDLGSTFTFSDIEAAAPPEPATFGTLLLGAFGALAARFRRRRQ